MSLTGRGGKARRVSTRSRLTRFIRRNPSRNRSRGPTSLPQSLPNDYEAGELNPKTTQTGEDAMALGPVPLASDNAIPLEDLEMTSDDFATKQGVTTSVDQPGVETTMPQLTTQHQQSTVDSQSQVNIANSLAGTDEVRSISPADLNSKGKERKSDTPPTSPVSRLIKHFQAMIPRHIIPDEFPGN